jgi:hypothetical protein
LWAKYPTRFPIARKYETFPSLLFIHTEKKGGTLPLKFANLGLKYWGLVIELGVVIGQADGKEWTPVRGLRAF